MPHLDLANWITATKCTGNFQGGRAQFVANSSNKNVNCKESMKMTSIVCSLWPVEPGILGLPQWHGIMTKDINT